MRVGNTEIVGTHPLMQKLSHITAKVAKTDATVLLTGESGTGKELVARLIHESSGRLDKPFVAVNCGTIPGDLLESEMFGHQKGSFTGAHDQRPGMFQLAHTGTIFLDEIGEMSLPMQVKLLRVLQDREIRPVGADKAFYVDVRVIAATNKDLLAEVKAGRFREDLYYRLQVIPITIPPLRERGARLDGNTMEAANDLDLATNDLGPLAWVLDELRKSMESASSALRHEATMLTRVMRQGRHPGIVPLQQAYLDRELRAFHAQTPFDTAYMAYRNDIERDLLVLAARWRERDG